MNGSSFWVIKQQQEEEEDDGGHAGLAGACVILAICFVLGVPGNLMVVWTILKHVKKRSHTVMLILHLAIADLLVLITLPLWIYSLARSWVFGEVVCKAMAYIINACMYASVFLITIMSLERFLAVRYPFASASWRRKQALRKVLLVVWVSSFLLSIPVIVTQVLGDDLGENQCLYRYYESTSQEAAILLLESLIGFVIPFFILVVCYGCLFSRIAQMNLRSKKKSTMLIASVVVLFALCWIPHHIGNLLSLVHLTLEEKSEEAQTLHHAVEAMTFVAGALVFISSTVNPILYVFAARNFRSSLRDTGIQKLFRHLSSTATGEANKERSFISRRQSSHTTTSQCCTESKAQIDLLVDICNNAAHQQSV
ncbi:leukotriene B4 receptor 1-like [Astyanax mexicanus]|uniref:Leukotriene B4 receptor 1-like n=1 Tax=Astyanax mexicanus TaxID=7994 RepID=A0A8T2KNX2_ASTMX|nr:leukotriene B4 receptor 1-like [Astyanax mexicanus]